MSLFNRVNLLRLRADAKVAPEQSYNLSSRDQRMSVQIQRPETPSGNVSFLSRLDYYLATSRFGLGLLLANTILSVVSCGIYIAETYVEDEDTLELLFEWQLILCVCFLFEYTLKLITAKDKLEYIIQLSSIVDLLTTIPLITVAALDLDIYRFRHDGLTLVNLFLTFRILRILRLVDIEKLLSFVESAITRHVYSIVLTIVCIIFLAAGLLHLVENARELWPEDKEYHVLPFFDVVYLIVTTITTVGYGDIAPITTLGRVVIMLMMITALVVVPRQTNKLVTLLGMTSVYARQSYKASKNVDHVVLTGETKDGGVTEFFLELFHPDHGSSNLQAVIVANGLPTQEIQDLLSDPRFSYKLKYLDGDVMSDKDLKRASLETAKAVFLLTNKFSETPEQEDANSILRALFLKRYLMSNGANEGGDTTLCIQLLSQESQSLFLSSVPKTSSSLAKEPQIICVDELKQILLAKSCLAPGISTMVNNLIASSGEECSPTDAPWMNEYNHGLGFEIYRVALSDVFRGLPFLNVVKLVYKHTNTLLFALEVFHNQAGTRVVLNPGNFVIPASGDIAGFVLAEDLEDAEVLGKRYTRQKNGAYTPVSQKDGPLRKFLGATGTYEQELHLCDALLDLRNQNYRASLLQKSASSSLGSKWQLTKNRLAGGQQDTLKYHKTKEARSLEEAVLESMGDMFDESFSGHIVVIGNSSNLSNFLLPLRQQDLGDPIPVVVLHSSLPSPADWHKIAYFKRVYFIKGSPLEYYDLDRAWINRASRAVLFTQDLKDSPASSTHLTDADTIFAYSLLAKLGGPNLEIIAELVSVGNVNFLNKRVNRHKKRAKQSLADSPQFAPAFASGNIFTASMLDTAACQAFYNPNLLNIVRKLIAGDNQVEAERWQHAARKDFPDGIPNSTVFQIPVLEKWHDNTYENLFDSLVAKQMLPLGLRRGVNPDAQDEEDVNHSPFVFTNPPPDCIVYHWDRVFVLSIARPEQDIAGTMMSKTLSNESTRYLLRASEEELEPPLGKSLEGFVTEELQRQTELIKKLFTKVEQLEKEKGT